MTSSAIKHTPSRWFPGARHCVALVAGTTDWRCVDCGQTFPTWPSDFEECPGHG